MLRPLMAGHARKAQQLLAHPASRQLIRYIIAGLFVMISLALGVEGSPLFVSKWALAFTAFVGANLFQFGFTNFCPLALILHKLGVKDASACSR